MKLNFWPFKGKSKIKDLTADKSGPQVLHVDPVTEATKIVADSFKNRTYGEHMRRNPPIPVTVGKFVPGEIPNTEYVEKIFGGKLPVDSSELFGSDHPSFDARATKSMNEYNRIYFEGAKSLTTVSDKVKLCLKTYGSCSSGFVHRKTGVSLKQAQDCLSDLKRQKLVTSEKSCVEGGLLVNSYALK